MVGVEHSGAWVAFPEVADLVRAQRFDEALAELYAHAERAPGDRAVTQAIERVREAMAESALTQLGSDDAVPRTTGVRLASSAELGADERYLISRIDGVATIAQLVRRSTLGRHRTIRALVWLVKSRLVEVRAPVTEVAAARRAALSSVLVADGNATQASLARTMLRVSLGRAVAYHTATGADEAIQLAARERPGLLVLDFRLPGRGDGIETLRAIRALPDLAGVPAALLVTRLEADYARARLPAAAALLIRPIERGSLDATLRQLIGETR